LTQTIWLYHSSFRQDAEIMTSHAYYLRKDDGKGDSHTTKTHEGVLGGIVVEYETTTGTTKGQKSQCRQKCHNNYGNPKASSYHSVVARNGIILEFHVKFGCVEVCHVGSTQHSNQYGCITDAAPLLPKDGRKLGIT
jgi:hypothetical protein